MGGIPYSGSLHSGQQIIDALIMRGEVDEAWEVLTSSGPRIAFTKEGKTFFIDPKVWVTVKNGKVTVVQGF